VLFHAVPVANSEYTTSGCELTAVGFQSDCDAHAAEIPLKVAPVHRADWVFAEPDVINTSTITLSGGPVFTRPGWSFVGVMISGNVPYKLASDKAFFETWTPEDSTETTSEATCHRLVSGYLPIRPTNVAAGVIRVAFQKLWKLGRCQPRGTLLVLPHEGVLPLCAVWGPVLPPMPIVILYRILLQWLWVRNDVASRNLDTM
jgi:hypothetical protein